MRQPIGRSATKFDCLHFFYEAGSAGRTVIKLEMSLSFNLHRQGSSVSAIACETHADHKNVASLDRPWPGTAVIYCQRKPRMSSDRSLRAKGGRPIPASSAAGWCLWNAVGEFQTLRQDESRW